MTQEDDPRPRRIRLEVKIELDDGEKFSNWQTLSEFAQYYPEGLGALVRLEIAFDAAVKTLLEGRNE